ncbi:uncharacterized protein LOC113147492 [Cyclospora cayetanensis]|uniref:Uncharacterized protein LOC113147492 n=1 Tax=Cyclospora cayetanensis TaxID=88456 RepID=A0A6P6S2K3_9EIME|nr:uncharacterized protein LOC113147492 [Cyclospora cayetanensis]
MPFSLKGSCDAAKKPVSMALLLAKNVKFRSGAIRLEPVGAFVRGSSFRAAEVETVFIQGASQTIQLLKQSLNEELTQMLSQPQRQTEQRELVQHMLNAMKQQELRVAQQTEEQQQLVAQANTEIQLEFADTTECRNTIQAELKAAAASLQQAKEELQHFRTVLERAKLDYNKGTVRRDRAAALLPVLVARKGELELQKKALLMESASRTKEERRGVQRRDNSGQAYTGEAHRGNWGSDIERGFGKSREGAQRHRKGQRRGIKKAQRLKDGIVGTRGGTDRERSI